MPLVLPELTRPRSVHADIFATRDFNGDASDYLEAPASNTGLDGIIIPTNEDAFTVCGFMRPDSDTPDDSCIVSRWRNQNNRRTLILRWDRVDHRPSFFWNNTGAAQAAVDSWPIGTWGAIFGSRDPVAGSIRVAAYDILTGDFLGSAETTVSPANQTFDDEPWRIGMAAAGNDEAIAQIGLVAYFFGYQFTPDDEREFTLDPLSMIDRLWHYNVFATNALTGNDYGRLGRSWTINRSTSGVGDIAPLRNRGRLRFPRRALVPAAGGETGTVTAAANADSAFAGAATALAAVTAGADAGEADAGLANALAGLVAQADATATESAVANALAAVSAAAAAGEDWAAQAQAAATLLAGVDAGDTESGLANALATLLANADAAATFVGAVGGATLGAISEGSDAAATFLGVVTAVADVSAGVDAGDLNSGLATALSDISAAASADEAISGTSQGADTGEITAAADAGESVAGQASAFAGLIGVALAGAIFSAQADATAFWSEAVDAGDLFELPPEVRMIIASIAITARIAGTVTITPRIGGTVTLGGDS